MEQIKFKTNIKCSGCVAQVTPTLNKTVGTNNWTVDLANPDRILTVSSSAAKSEQIKSAIEQAGFKAEAISS